MFRWHIEVVEAGRSVAADQKTEGGKQHTKLLRIHEAGGVSAV